MGCLTFPTCELTVMGVHLGLWPFLQMCGRLLWRHTGHQESRSSVGATNELLPVLLVEESVAPGTTDGGEDSTRGIASCASKTSSAVFDVPCAHLINSSILMLPMPDDLLRNVSAIVLVDAPSRGSNEANAWLRRTVSQVARHGHSEEDWKLLFALSLTVSPRQYFTLAALSLAHTDVLVCPTLASSFIPTPLRRDDPEGF